MIDCSASGLQEPLMSFMPQAKGLTIVVNDLCNPAISVKIVLSLPNMIRLARLVRAAQRGETDECVELLEQPGSLFTTRDTNGRPKGGK